MVDSWRSDIIKIPAPMTQLRFWRNTSVARVTSGSASLVQNLLGYEWDEAPDNGAQPAGLIRLSSTTLSRRQLSPGLGACDRYLYRHP